MKPAEIGGPPKIEPADAGRLESAQIDRGVPRGASL